MTTATDTSAPGRPELLALITTGTVRLAQAWAALTVAQRAFLTRLARVQAGPGAARAIRTALASFNAAVAAFDRDTRALAERWAAQDLPTAYRDGALRALTAARSDVRLFQWTTNHQAAVTAITAVYWADLVRRITDTVRRAQVFARAATDAARTPQGADPDTLVAEHPLDSVVYANSTRHPAAAWARAALTAQAAVTANRGAINTARYELAVEWVEIHDGPECGWVSHEDPDHADGTLRTLADADAYPIAHPGCIRQINPRPDLTGRTDFAPGESI